MKTSSVIFWIVSLGFAKSMEFSEPNFDNDIQLCKETGNGCKRDADVYTGKPPEYDMVEKWPYNSNSNSNGNGNGNGNNNRNRNIPATTLYDSRYNIGNLEDTIYQLVPQRAIDVSVWKNRLFGNELKPATVAEVKRTFSPWGGKRSLRNTDRDIFTLERPGGLLNWEGKRTSKFYSWGGKRSASLPDELEQYRLEDRDLNEYLADVGSHKIIRREVGVYEHASDEAERQKRASNEKLCATLDRNVNLTELFKEFLKWSRKRPEQKKDSFYTKDTKLNALRSADKPHRRGTEFFSWGGKRNSYSSQDNGYNNV